MTTEQTEPTTEPTERDTTLNVYQRMHAVMMDVGYIQKDKIIDGKYAAVTHDSVTAKLRPSLLRHGVLVIPSVENHKLSEAWQTKGGARMTLTECDAVVAFINIDDPADRLAIHCFGYGIDSQDKGPGKCLSYIVKMAMLKCFGLESGDDPDQYQNVDSPPMREQKMKSRPWAAVDRQAPKQGRQQAQRPQQPAQGQRQSQERNGGGDGRISEAQKKRLFAIAYGAGWQNDQIYAVVDHMCGSAHTRDVPWQKYDALCDRLAQGPGDEYGKEMPISEPTAEDLRDEPESDSQIDPNDGLVF